MGAKKRIETRPLQLQRTGLGVVIGLGVLLLLVAVLWWAQDGESAAAWSDLSQTSQAIPSEQLRLAGENDQ